jgi:hypothetical protein
VSKNDDRTELIALIVENIEDISRLAADNIAEDMLAAGFHRRGEC